MKAFFTSALLLIGHSIFAHFENAQITTTQGKSLDVMVDVYAPGILVGNKSSLRCIVNQDTIDYPLKRIAALQLGIDEYHVLTLTDHDADLFDEPAKVSHLVLAKLTMAGTVSLYDYYYSGNSRFENGKANKSFAKALHRRPVLRSKKGASVVYKSTYKAAMKLHFPHNYETLQHGFPQMADAVAEGNQLISRN